MATVLEIACRARADQADNARGWYRNEAIDAWSSLPGLTAFDLYVPSAGGARDPMVDDGSGPLFLMMLEFSSPAAARTGHAISEIRRAIVEAARRS